MSRNKRGAPHHEEEHADETWLVPYSDILTLLLALFIVLFASSQVDQKKFEQMAQSFAGAFGGGASFFDNVRAVPQAAADQPQPPNNVQSLFSAMGNEKATNFQQETAQLLEAKRKLDKFIEENNLTGAFGTSLTDDGLMVRIKDSALFASGQADLLPASRAYAGTIATMLAALSQRVVISGHTDNMPINTYEFPTNWDLSSKRAVNFMKFLLAQDSKLQPARFSAVGHGEYRPAAANTTEEGRAQNRRVEVLIVRKYSP
ncbi:MAG TPA: flagellar motor protein MotB [Negativicutes bacterium]|nr:flagellar motor protein MotB [Negativicutes bacterium]